MHQVLGLYHQNFSESNNFSLIHKNNPMPEGYKYDISLYAWNSVLERQTGESKICPEKTERLIWG